MLAAVHRLDHLFFCTPSVGFAARAIPRPIITASRHTSNYLEVGVALVEAVVVDFRGRADLGAQR